LSSYQREVSKGGDGRTGERKGGKRKEWKRKEREGKGKEGSEEREVLWSLKNSLK